MSTSTLSGGPGFKNDYDHFRTIPTQANVRLTTSGYLVSPFFAMQTPDVRNHAAYEGSDTEEEDARPPATLSYTRPNVSRAHSKASFDAKRASQLQAVASPSSDPMGSDTEEEDIQADAHSIYGSRYPSLSSFLASHQSDLATDPHVASGSGDIMPPGRAQLFRMAADVVRKRQLAREAGIRRDIAASERAWRRANKHVEPADVIDHSPSLRAAVCVLRRAVQEGQLDARRITRDDVLAAKAQASSVEVDTLAESLAQLDLSSIDAQASNSIMSSKRKGKKKTKTVRFEPANRLARTSSGNVFSPRRRANTELPPLVDQSAVQRVEERLDADLLSHIISLL